MASRKDRFEDSQANDQVRAGGQDKEGQPALHPEEEKLPLVTRLTLSALLMGSEAVVIFEQLYTLPTLQILNMPLRFVSLSGVFAGCIATFVVPLLSFYIDKGVNPSRRRAWVIGIGPLVMVFALIVIVMASVMNTEGVYPDSANNRSSSWNNSNLSPGGTINGFMFPFSWNSSNFPSNNISTTQYDYLGNLTVHTKASPQTPMPMTDIPVKRSSVTDDRKVHASSVTQLPTNMQHSTEDSIVPERERDKGDGGGGNYVPLPAAVALMGFVLLDVCYDCVSSSVKTWMLTCSPPSRSKSTLSAGIVVTSFGGMLSSVFGMLDLAPAFGFAPGSTSAFTFQLALQAALVVFILEMGTTSTLIAGKRQLRKRAIRLDKEIAADERNESLFPETTESILVHDNNGGSRNRHTSTGSVESSFMQSFRHYLTTSETHAVPFVDTLRSNPPKPRKSRYGAVNDESKKDPDAVALLQSTEYKGGEETHDEHRSLRLQQDRTEDSGQKESYSMRSFKVAIAILGASTFFSVGVITVFMLTGSDIVAKTIFDGDPFAEPGSDAFVRYNEGVRTASYGFLLYFVVYLLFSFIQQRIIHLIGYKAEYMTVQLLTGVCLAVLALTTRIEAYFLLCAVAGTHRAVFHVVSFAVASDLAHAEAQRNPDGGPPKVGLVVSLVTTCMPLGYCLLFPWVGPLEDATGTATSPLWLATTCACLAAALFSVLKI